MTLMAFNNELVPMTATLISTDGMDKKHFNIEHGSKVIGGWQMRLGVDDLIVANELQNNTYIVELLGRDFILLPIMHKSTGDQIEDVYGNKKYYVSRSRLSDNGDILLFLTLPKSEDVTYEVVGQATIIGIGKDKCIDDGIEIILDAPMILIEGTTSITIIETENGSKKYTRLIYQRGKLSVSIEKKLEE